MGQLTIECDTGKISDGYHTFDDLYTHRHELFIALMLSFPEISFRTKRNKEGEEWPGWFIAGMNLPGGQITYHLPERYWFRLESLTTLDRNADYDGHTSVDVLERLAQWSTNKTLHGN